jgi:hypothetical protein
MTVVSMVITPLGGMPTVYGLLDLQDLVSGILPPEDTGDEDTANNDPIAENDSTETDENTEVTIDVLANDSDPDGDELIIANASDGDNGFVTINDDQTITYTPNEGFSGEDSFEYTINDGQDGFATAAVFVTVNPVNEDTAN